MEWTPVKGSTIVLEVGLPVLVKPFWQPEVILQADESAPLDTLSYTFTPRDRLTFVPGSYDSLRCHDLSSPNIYIKYYHYGPGFFDKIVNDPFDILASTDRFGALYSDTLTIPIDTSRVCPPDCE